MEDLSPQNGLIEFVGFCLPCSDKIKCIQRCKRLLLTIFRNLKKCDFFHFLKMRKIKFQIFHIGKCIRRFAGIYAYCRYFIDRM